MNVYDFDNTIYDGESVVDFYLFALRKHPDLITVLPKMVSMLIKYKCCRISTEELFSLAGGYAKKILSKADFEGMIPEFWDKNFKKIKPFYLINRREDDVILSASWNLLINEACGRLGIKNVVASEINIKTGEVLRLCFREKKPQIFAELFGNCAIDEFYTDSLNDSPMFDMARRVFLVKRNEIKELTK